MLRLPVVILLSALTVMAQSHPGKAKTPTAPKAPAAPAAQKPAAPAPKTAASAEMPANKPVITLHGLCANVTNGLAQSSGAKSAAGACTSTISKAAFEKLVGALPISQSLPPAQRRKLAEQYVELLTIAQAGIKAGEEKNPKLPELEKFQRMQNLAQLYIRSLEEKYRNPSQADVDAYYDKNKEHFEQITLERVYVPRNDPAAKNATPDQKSAWEAKAKEAATDAKARAAKGEDMTALQKDVYTKLGLKMNPPNVNVGAIRKGALPPQSDKAIFALQPGGIYESDEPTAFVLYKAVSRKTLTKDEAKTDITRALYQEKMNQRKKEVSDTVKADYNEEYFGPPAPAGPGAAMRPGGAMPSAARSAAKARPAARHAATAKHAAAAKPK